MNCDKTRELLESLISGKLSGEVSRAVCAHLASCRDCASGLSASEWIEVLPVLDEGIEVSGEFSARFHAKLRERLHSRSSNGWSGASWWVRVAGWGWPRRLAVAGSLAALVVAGILLGRLPDSAPDYPAAYSDLGIAENLPLFEDMAVINNLELLEDFDTIENLPTAKN